MNINFSGQVLTKPQVKNSDLSFKGTASIQAKQIVSDYFSSRLQEVCTDLSKRDSKKAQELLSNLPEILKKFLS